ncbi:MAG: ubiquinone/menaquinone biosynthesis methyltransferase [Acidobacteria bacterium]|nr:ubiquinone/menaquinone biosynthesis methyltransferase [Acidobacteriota bacterium]
MIPAEEQRKARAVQQMFGRIAHRYDLLNHLLSANLDRRWRKTCARELGGRRPEAKPRILDIGCGTADLALQCAALGPVYACDFSEPMLRLAGEKISRFRPAHRIACFGADALVLPFRDGTFDAVVSAFVIRNLAGLDRGLGEMRRVLRSGGTMAALDFGMPRNRILGPLYWFYFTRVLPAVGRVVSGVDGPYRYLPASVEAFPPPEDMAARMTAAGFDRVEYRLLTGGIVVLWLGRAGD